MYITCQQCSTIFRLDEKLLKPTGSKVRCSQCDKLFVAYPSAPVDEAPTVSAPAVEAVSTPASEAALDQELEGIDLAELDSILEQESALDSDEVADGQAAVEEVEDLIDFNETDLDLDFETALEGDENVVPTTTAEAAEPASDELDLDMDFDLVGGEDDPTGMATDQGGQAEAMETGADPVAGDLNNDIDLALNDFEGALGQPETGADEVAEISDDDFDLDFSLDTEPVADDTELSIAGDDVAVEPEADSDDLNLGDLGSLLDEVDTAAEEDEEEVEDVELSLDDTPEAPPSVNAEEITTAAADGDDLDLGDLDALLDGDDSTEEVEVEDVELSLDDGGQISSVETPVEGDATPPLTTADDELDLGDLDALLKDDDSEEAVEVEDVEFSLEAAPSEPGTSAPADTLDDLDLGDLDALLDADDADEDTKDENLELSLDDGNELAVDQEPTLEMASGSAGDDDLDLGDLDGLLDADESASTEKVLSPDEDSEELDMSDLNNLLEDDEAPVEGGGDPDLSLELESPVIAEATDQDDDIEDLEFELDAEFEDKPLAQTAKPVPPRKSQESPDEELDLTDIEQMLENETLGLGRTGGIEPDRAGGSEKWREDQEEDLEPAGEGEIDLAEIEEAIDAVDTEIDGSGLLDEDEDLELDLDLDVAEATTEPEIEELDLELEMVSDADSTPLEAEAAEYDDLDLTDLDFSVEDEVASAPTETVDAGDIELEFQIEEHDTLPMAEDVPVLEAADAAAGASAATTEAVVDGDAFTLEDTVPMQPVRESAPERPVKAPKKKGTSKSLVFILILALLGGGGYFGYDYVIKNDIQIPYLSDYINPKPKDPAGTMNLSTLEINSKFLENEKSGRLFIVTGKVRNGYNVPCKMVRLRGKLFTKGKVLSKTEHTYAGVIIPDQELASKGLIDLKKQLSASLGAAAGVQVNPGQTIPFMVVFSELPDDLDEFAIELLSATKMQ